MLTYNFENPVSTLAKCKRNDLAVVDTEWHESLVSAAVNRSVYVHKYLNKLKTEYSKL